MIKYKIERTTRSTFLIVQGQKGQQISQREYYAINAGQIPGLIRAELVQKGKNFKLCYNISGMISLKEYLFNPLSKDSFIKLLENILSNLKALHNSYYNHQYILMDVNAAMVNPSTQAVSFVYVPITFYESGTSLKLFLLSIIQCCTFLSGEDISCVQECIRILNNGINFSLFDLEEYLKKISNNGKPKMKLEMCPRCGSPLKSNVNFCSSCGAKLSGISIENRANVYDPMQNKILPARQEPFNDNNSSIQPQPFIYGAEKGGTVSDYINEVPTSVPPARRSGASLLRVKNGERIIITSNDFRIGKDVNNDYAIRDNPAISRYHAVIKFIGEKWYVSDLNSTNKTYINDIALNPNIDVELYNRICVTFANDAFIFQIN